MITVIEPEWGLSTWKIEDQPLAAQLYGIATAKTAAARKLDIAVPLYCETTYYVTVLTERLLGARMLLGPNGQSCVIISNQDGPALALETKERSSEVLVHYNGKKPGRTLLDQRLQALRDMCPALPEQHPYGWERGGRITTLFFNAPFELYDDGRFIGGEPYAYVLQGAQMPEPLRMPRQGGDKEWPNRVLTAVQARLLIPLRERFHNLPGEVWSIGDGKHDYIQFEKPDRHTPSFVSSEPYLHWHPREAYPGELFKRTEKAQLRLRKWLSW